jgi:tRNA G18 (ribose-2'-O)-methylase SpoU
MFLLRCVFNTTTKGSYSCRRYIQNHVVAFSTVGGGTFMHPNKIFVSSSSSSSSSSSPLINNHHTRNRVWTNNNYNYNIAYRYYLISHWDMPDINDYINSHDEPKTKKKKKKKKKSMNDTDTDNTNNNNDIIYSKSNMVNVISSTESLTAKKIHALIKYRKKRQQLQQVVVEGPRMIFDLYRNMHTRQYIQRILIDTKLYEQYMLYFQQLYNLYPTPTTPTTNNSVQRHSDNDDDNSDNIENNNENSSDISRNNDNDISDETSDVKIENLNHSNDTSTTTSTTNEDSDNNNKNQNKYNKQTIVFHPTFRDVLQACCTDTVTHQGIVAICKIPNYNHHENDNNNNNDSVTINNTPTTEPEQQQQKQYRKMYLVCDAIQDPGNIGTLIRTAVACGVSAIYVLPNACDVWNPKAIRSAMGATFAIPIIECISWDDCYSKLYTSGCTSNTIYAATMLDNTNEEFNIEEFIQDTNNNQEEESEEENDMNTYLTKSTPHYEVDWIGMKAIVSSSNNHNTSDDDDHVVIPTASALIIGSEGNGLTIDIRNGIEQQQIQTVYVPMVTSEATTNTPSTESSSSIGVESLNAAICGSIILFEYLRQIKTATTTTTTPVTTTE